MPQLRTIPGLDGSARPKKNANVATIAAKRIVKATAVADECDLAVAATDLKLVGVTTAAIPTGKYGDVQHAGKAILTSGAAVAVGDKITADAAGKGVTAAPAAGTNNGIVGTAVTLTSGADIDFEIELSPEGTTLQG
jgi:hypothetical protein